jgi:hypothetical protein
VLPPKTGNIKDVPESNVCPFTVALPAPSFKNETLRTPVGIIPESVTRLLQVDAVIAAASSIVIVAEAAISQLAGHDP